MTELPPSSNINPAETDPVESVVLWPYIPSTYAGHGGDVLPIGRLFRFAPQQQHTHPVYGTLDECRARGITHYCLCCKHWLHGIQDRKHHCALVLHKDKRRKLSASRFKHAVGFFHSFYRQRNYNRLDAMTPRLRNTMVNELFQLQRVLEVDGLETSQISPIFEEAYSALFQSTDQKMTRCEDIERLSFLKLALWKWACFKITPPLRAAISYDIESVQIYVIQEWKKHKADGRQNNDVEVVVDLVAPWLLGAGRR